jgi:hypothetical protein
VIDAFHLRELFGIAGLKAWFEVGEKISISKNGLYGLVGLSPLFAKPLSPGLWNPQPLVWPRESINRRKLVAAKLKANLVDERFKT